VSAASPVPFKPAAGEEMPAERPAYDLIELFFFAYRDFVSDPDRELIEKDFIESRTGTADRRQRLLHTTPKGHDLALKLAKLQTRRIMRALSAVESGKAEVSRYLLSMIDSDDREHVSRLVFGPESKA
jgi:hypothetical protein